MNGLEYAIQMEVDGEKFYREQALVNKDNKLNRVFISMAEEEKRHAKIIKEMLIDRGSSVAEENLENVKNVFSDATGVDSGKSVINQIDAYRKALEMEEKSIALYKRFSSEYEEDKDTFEFLIKQEEAHYSMIEEIIELVSRPDEWVESAEFGVRTEKY